MEPTLRWIRLILIVLGVLVRCSSFGVCCWGVEGWNGAWSQVSGFFYGHSVGDLGRCVDLASLFLSHSEFSSADDACLATMIGRLRFSMSGHTDHSSSVRPLNLGWFFNIIYSWRTLTIIIIVDELVGVIYRLIQIIFKVLSVLDALIDGTLDQIEILWLIIWFLLSSGLHSCLCLTSFRIYFAMQWT